MPGVQRPTGTNGRWDGRIFGGVGRPGITRAREKHRMAEKQGMWLLRVGKWSHEAIRRGTEERPAMCLCLYGSVLPRSNAPRSVLLWARDPSRRPLVMPSVQVTLEVTWWDPQATGDQLKLNVTQHLKINDSFALFCVPIIQEKTRLSLLQVITGYPHRRRIGMCPELSKRIAIEMYGNSSIQFGTNSNSSPVWMGPKEELLRFDAMNSFNVTV